MENDPPHKLVFTMPWSWLHFCDTKLMNFVIVFFAFFFFKYLCKDVSQKFTLGTKCYLCILPKDILHLRQNTIHIYFMGLRISRGHFCGRVPRELEIWPVIFTFGSGF